MHMFKHWSDYLSKNFETVQLNSITRCNSQCRYELIMANGRNAKNEDDSEISCAKACTQVWMGNWDNKKKVLYNFISITI